MIHELRIYHCLPGRLPALLKRFETRTLKIWEKHGIEVDFTVHKHKLDEVKVAFEADEYHHIGDTNMDEHYAVLHGFRYLDVAIHKAEPWMFMDGEEQTAPPTEPTAAAPTGGIAVTMVPNYGLDANGAPIAE